MRTLFEPFPHNLFYVNRINRYFYVVFPWELGNTMDRVDPKDFPEIMKLYNWEA